METTHLGKATPLPASPDEAKLDSSNFEIISFDPNLFGGELTAMHSPSVGLAN